MMKAIIQIVLLMWFVVLGLFVFIPSYQILRAASGSKWPDPPAPPPPPIFASMAADGPALPRVDEAAVKNYQEQVAAYTLQVGAYREHLSSYKTLLESAARPGGAYTLVVKDTLMTFASTFATALLAYVFVRAGAQIVNNHILVKNGQPPRPLEL